MSQSRSRLKIIAVCHLFPTSLLSFPSSLLNHCHLAFLNLWSLYSLYLSLLLWLSLSLSLTHTHTQRKKHPGAIWMLVVLQGEPGRGRLLMSALTKPRSRPWIANSSLHWPRTLEVSDKTWRIACITGKTASLHYATPFPLTKRPHWYQRIHATHNTHAHVHVH